MSIKIGLIRVLTTTDKRFLNAHGSLLQNLFPGWKVVSECIGGQPEGIHDESTRDVAVPKIIELGRAMARDGLAAIIVSCADDPGVDELRALVDIPVIGAGSACACLARALAARVGTLGIGERAPAIMREVLGRSLVAQLRPEGVATTIDLMTEQGRRNAVAAARQVRECGAEAIALACTGYSTAGMARELRQAAGIPVVDAVEAAGLATWHVTHDTDPSRRQGRNRR